jgi:membrane protease YdiL (CAAX protease family)
MRQAVVFSILSLALSWSAWGVAILTDSSAAGWRVAGAFGPSLAALGLAAISGRSDLSRLLSGFSRWRASPWAWVFALLGTAAIGVTALLLDMAAGGEVDWPAAQVLMLAPVIFLWVLLFSVAGEETGWRGYLLPRLLSLTGPVRASLALGLVWALWHLPLWALPGDFHAAIPAWLFGVQILAVSVLYTWLWLRSGGSLVLAHVFHAASNTTLGLLPLIPGEGADGLRPLTIAIGLLCVVSVFAGWRLSRAR